MTLFINILLSIPLIGAFAIFALGIVVIYQASRVLNLAHGAMAMFPAYIVYTLVERGVPVGIALLVGVAFGALLGIAIERTFIRGLRGTSATAQTVGTVAALAVLISLASRIWGTAPLRAPAIVAEGGIAIGASTLRWGSLALFVVAIVLSTGMLALFQFTDIGLAMRAAAQNRRAASLMGVDPDRTTALAWAIGGALAAVAGAMLAAVTNLQPTTLSMLVLPAFVAALLGGLESLKGALVGAAGVGLVFGLVPSMTSLPLVGDIASQPGSPQLALTIVAFAVMALRGQRLAAATRDDAAFGAGGRVGGAKRRSVPWPLQLAGLAAVLLWVWVPNLSSYSILANSYQAGIYALIALSLVVLTGWVGQISLGHAAFVGIGAFTTGLLVRSLGIPFPANLPLSAAIAGIVAAALGLVALRVRGLYLAVATLVFSWMADSFLFASSSFVGTGGSSSIEGTEIGITGGWPNLDLTNRRVLYYIMIAVLTAVIFAVLNIRDSKTGRAFFAIRGSEIAASSLGISVMQVKVFAFAVSGVIAGIAGNLTIIGQQTVVPSQFAFTASLFFLSIAVVGGLSSVRGALLSAVLFAALNELFYRVAALSGYLDLVSALLLTFAVLAQGNAMRQVIDTVRGAFRTVGERLGEIEAVKKVMTIPSLRDRREEAIEAAVIAEEQAAEAKAEAGIEIDAESAKAGAAKLLSIPRAERPILVEGRNITVRFGGLTAVSDASIQVRQGEIVGLIGPNGAGKTTLFNSLSGLNTPTEGSVYLYGEDVSQVPVHERAQRGLGRTFQVLQLFGQLTVRENLLVATHCGNPSNSVEHLVATDRSIREEVVARRRVEGVLRHLDLGELADRPVAGLPFGVLRMVEVARAVVTEAPLIMLDEPASGLDNAETERLSNLLLQLRGEFGVSMLLIEHDVEMVTGISDYMYVLAQGKLLAEGEPAEVQRHPAVIAAYLGESPEDAEPETTTPVPTPV